MSCCWRLTHDLLHFFFKDHWLQWIQYLRKKTRVCSVIIEKMLWKKLKNIVEINVLCMNGRYFILKLRPTKTKSFHLHSANVVMSLYSHWLCNIYIYNRVIMSLHSHWLVSTTFIMHSIAKREKSLNDNSRHAQLVNDLLSRHEHLIYCFLCKDDKEILYWIVFES